MRDQEGNILWMGPRGFPKPRTALEIKVGALRWAILVTSSFGYKKVIYESDLKQLV